VYQAGSEAVRRTLIIGAATADGFVVMEDCRLRAGYDTCLIWKING
jgi:hypothetical protein